MASRCSSTLRERAPTVDVVLMTAFDDMPTVVAAMRGGAVEFLVKPVDLHQLRALIDRVFDDRRTRAARAERRRDRRADSSDELIGRDARMIGVYKLVGQAAVHARDRAHSRRERHRQGAGRARDPRELRRAPPSRSCRSTAPRFRARCSSRSCSATCAARSPARTKRGAAASRSPARGTIFLDEIGDTSLDFQSKLLRVIQDREFQPVGAERTERTEARVIAATHQDLEQMVADRRFREDLYYRLRVVEIVDSAAARAAGRHPAARATHGAARQLLARHRRSRALRRGARPPDRAHDWPGNVRELENCVMRAVVIASGSVIRAGAPVDRVAANARSSSRSRRSSISSASTSTRVLAATDGQKGRAAEILGVSRPRLNRLLEKYGLE